MVIERVISASGRHFPGIADFTESEYPATVQAPSRVGDLDFATVLALFLVGIDELDRAGGLGIGVVPFGRIAVRAGIERFLHGASQ